MFVELYFNDDVKIEANWHPVVAVKRQTTRRYQFYFGVMRRWYESNVKFGGIISHAGANIPSQGLPNHFRYQIRLGGRETACKSN